MRAILSLLLLASAGCRSDDDKMRGTVVVLVVDGARAGETWGEGPSQATGEDPWQFMPRIWDELVPEGVRGNNLWNLGITITTPAHVDMMGGRRQDFTNYPVDLGVGLYMPDLPLLPELLRQDQGFDANQVIVAGNTLFMEPLAQSLWPGASEFASESVVFGQGLTQWPPDRDALARVRELLKERQPRLLLANLHGVDRAAHYGDTDAYMDAVRGNDALLADFWAWIKDTEEYADDTWLLVTTDHGRHDVGGCDPIWREHGDSCNGCRHISFVLLGPGVRQGLTMTEPITLGDLGVTLAALLGQPMPWADGVVVDSLFGAPTGMPSRTGIFDVAVVPGHRAEARWISGDLAHRSEIVLDGERISSDDAIAAEAPVLVADGDRASLCFREIVLNPLGDYTGWNSRCFDKPAGQAAWQDLGTLLPDCGPFWKPSMHYDAKGNLLLAYAFNPEGVAAVNDDLGVGLALHDGVRWQTTLLTSTLTFPTDLVAAFVDDGFLVAGGMGRSEMEGRFTRDVFISHVDLLSKPVSWPHPEPVGFGGILAPGRPWRMERPALRVTPSGPVDLAAIATTEEGSIGILAQSWSGGETWDEVHIPHVPGSTLAHVTPLWLTDRVVFAVLDEGSQEVLLCGVSTEGPVHCVPTGSSRILGTTVGENGGLEAILDVGTGEWESVSFPLSDLEMP